MSDTTSKILVPYVLPWGAQNVQNAPSTYPVSADPWSGSPVIIPPTDRFLTPRTYFPTRVVNGAINEAQLAALRIADDSVHRDMQNGKSCTSPTFTADGYYVEWNDTYSEWVTSCCLSASAGFFAPFNPLSGAFTGTAVPGLSKPRGYGYIPRDVAKTGIATVEYFMDSTGLTYHYNRRTATTGTITWGGPVNQATGGIGYASVCKKMVFISVSSAVTDSAMIRYLDPVTTPTSGLTLSLAAAVYTGIGLAAFEFLSLNGVDMIFTLYQGTARADQRFFKNTTANAAPSWSVLSPALGTNTDSRVVGAAIDPVRAKFVVATFSPTTGAVTLHESSDGSSWSTVTPVSSPWTSPNDYRVARLGGRNLPCSFNILGSTYMLMLADTAGSTQLLWSFDRGATWYTTSASRTAAVSTYTAGAPGLYTPKIRVGEAGAILVPAVGAAGGTTTQNAVLVTQFSGYHAAQV